MHVKMQDGIQISQKVQWEHYFFELSLDISEVPKNIVHFDKRKSVTIGPWDDDFLETFILLFLFFSFTLYNLVH